jgi:mitosis inhibitor protein kinase SWE1
MLLATYRAQEVAASDVGAGESSRNRLDKDFVLLQSLGAGAFSQVWKVRERASGAVWAVKAGKPYTGKKNRSVVMKPVTKTKLTYRLRQLEEVSILHSLTTSPHENIISFVDAWEYRSRLYLRTEVGECGDLARFLEAIGDFGGLGEIRCWKLLAETTAALAHIHALGIVHLDIKPSNILITRAGSIKVADFGMSSVCQPDGRVGGLSPALPSVGADGMFTWSAQVGDDADMASASDSETSAATEAGGIRTMMTIPSPIVDREVEGDREYLSPEALGGTVGVYSDVYSLGVLMLEVVGNVAVPSSQFPPRLSAP